MPTMDIELSSNAQRAARDATASGEPSTVFAHQHVGSFQGNPSAVCHGDNNGSGNDGSIGCTDEPGVMTAQVRVNPLSVLEGGFIQAYPAQVIEGTILTNKRRQRLLWASVAAFLTVAMAITLGVVLSGKNDSSEPVATNVPKTVAPTTPVAISTTPSMGPTMSPSFSPGIPFTTTEELYQAVDAYLSDPSSTLAREYGYPIGWWNVSAVTDMTGLFSSSRNGLAGTFNEAIDEWDVSRVTSMSSMFQGMTFR